MIQFAGNIAQGRLSTHSVQLLQPRMGFWGNLNVLDSDIIPWIPLPEPILEFVPLPPPTQAGCGSGYSAWVVFWAHHCRDQPVLLCRK